MKKITLLICCALLSLTFCTREDNELSVIYEANKLDTNASSIRVMYTIAGDRDVTKAPIEGDFWRSDTIDNMKEGRTARLTIERISGNSPYRLRIFRNGVAIETTDTDTLGSEFTIATEI